MSIGFKELKIKLSFPIFSPYFKDEKDFNDFIDKLPTDRQNKFLKLSVFYKNFIKESIIKDASIINYFSSIMFFSLIEALMSEVKHKTFDQYLFENFQPIQDSKTLKCIYDQYIKKFGCQRQVKDFFDKHVDEDCKLLFAHSIRHLDDKYSSMSVEERIKLNIKLFYQWRSNFVHSAITPDTFRKYGVGLTKLSGKKMIHTTPYQKEDFEVLFEHGFLNYFGYKNKFKHGDIKEKIDKYKKHTGTLAMWSEI